MSACVSHFVGLHEIKLTDSIDVISVRGRIGGYSDILSCVGTPCLVWLQVISNNGELAEVVCQRPGYELAEDIAVDPADDDEPRRVGCGGDREVSLVRELQIVATSGEDLDPCISDSADDERMNEVNRIGRLGKYREPGSHEV